MRPSNDGRCCRHCSARPAPASTTSSATTTSSFVFFFYSSCIYLLHLTSNQNSSALLSSFIRHTSIPFFHSFRALSEASVSATVAPKHLRRPPASKTTVHFIFGSSLALHSPPVLVCIVCGMCVCGTKAQSIIQNLIILTHAKNLSNIYRSRCLLSAVCCVSVCRLCLNDYVFVRRSTTGRRIPVVVNE